VLSVLNETVTFSLGEYHTLVVEELCFKENQYEIEREGEKPKKLTGL